MNLPLPSNHTPVIRGSLGHRILSSLLGQDSLTSGAIKKQAEIHLAVSDLRLQKLITLQNQGFIEHLNPDAWRLTPKGIDICLELGTPMKKTAPVRSAKQKKAEIYTRPTYDGWELGRTCTRPGAYDAFDKPSRIHNNLHYRDGRIERA